MGGFSWESESWVSCRNTNLENNENFKDQIELESEADQWAKLKKPTEKMKKKTNQVMLEGYVGAGDEDDLTRTKSLTDDDLEELKGCLDLGFGFSHDEIPELSNTLPALELCYSMSQNFPEDSNSADSCSSLSSSVPNWKISCPGDGPDDVKARLKLWAQAVACTVRLSTK